MTHEHTEAVWDLRKHLKEDHGDAQDYKGITGRALIWIHLQKHPGYEVVDLHDGTILPK